MVMFASGIRIEDRPSQWLPLNGDPAGERERLGALLRGARPAPSAQGALWPAPEVPMRIVEPGSLRGGAARLLKALRVAGWRSVVTYARGTTFDAQRRPGGVVSSWAIRAAMGDRRIVAIWWERTAGRFESRGVLCWGDRLAVWLGLREFEKGV